MPTTKKRINISVSRDVERALAALARRDEVASATKAGELIRRALEIEEDEVLDAIASARDRRGTRFVPHARAWG